MEKIINKWYWIVGALLIVVLIFVIFKYGVLQEMFNPGLESALKAGGGGGG